MVLDIQNMGARGIVQIEEWLDSLGIASRHRMTRRWRATAA